MIVTIPYDHNINLILFERVINYKITRPHLKNKILMKQDQTTENLVG